MRIDLISFPNHKFKTGGSSMIFAFYTNYNSSLKTHFPLIPLTMKTTTSRRWLDTTTKTFSDVSVKVGQKETTREETIEVELITPATVCKRHWRK